MFEFIGRGRSLCKLLCSGKWRLMGVGVILATLVFSQPRPVVAATIACTPTSGFNVCYRITYSGGAQSIVVPSGVTSIDARHGIWQSLGPGDVITFTAPYTVVQADIDNLQ